MKKFISLLLTAAMLTVPVYGDEVYTQEDLVLRAKEVCQINDSSLDFKITSTNEIYGMKFYNYEWNDPDKKGSINVSVGSDGVVYSYNDYINYDNGKTKVYTDKEATAKVENFLKDALKDKYNDIAFECLESDSYDYTFVYNVMYNGVEYDGNDLRISVDKYSNKVTNYYYPGVLLCVKNSSFEGKKTSEEAEEVMKDNVELGYLTKYDYVTKEYDIKLLYRMKDYLLRAEDLKPLEASDLIAYESDAKSGGVVKDTGVSKSTLTPAEIQGIENVKNAVTEDEAIKVFNAVFEQNITKNDVTVDYEKEYTSDKYNIILNSKNADKNFIATIDYKGRVTSYYSYNGDDSKTMSEEELAARAENLIKKLDCGYDLTTIEKNNKSYNENSFTCNILRNNKISFSECINLSFDKAGNITSLYASYLPDEIFNIDTVAELSEAEAYAIAVEYYGFKPYYSIKENYNDISVEYEAVPVYGFNEKFSIDAVNGDILNFNGQKISENGIKVYTDISDQWYADIAVNLAYMGCAFDGDEFNGDDNLTYGALGELTSDIHYLNTYIENKDENALMTRYEFAEYMMVCMGIKKVSNYNEIYVKPFNDVDFEHTGAVAILKAMGVVGGNSFRGNDNITRGEAAAIIYRYMINK